jgi:hypothetical protein
MGYKPLNWQIGGQRHVFPCGCSGRLPKEGRSNKFAIWLGYAWGCRVSAIIGSSVGGAKRLRYKSVNPETPHAVIRKLMEAKKCERCHKELLWIIKRGITPHLHHSHLTGEIYGFVHMRCNWRALEQEIERLKQLLGENL